jgi:two-component system phosphate regulon sensor histidine kinase PhoR
MIPSGDTPLFTQLAFAWAVAVLLGVACLFLGAALWQCRRELVRRRRAAAGAECALRALQSRDYNRALAVCERYLPGDVEFTEAPDGEAQSREHQNQERPEMIGEAQGRQALISSPAPSELPARESALREALLREGAVRETATTQEVALAFRRMVLAFEAQDREQQIARRELEDVLASLQDSVLVVDDEARLRFLNSAAQSFFRVRAEDVLGAQILEALPSFGLDSVVRDALRDGQHHSREVSLYGTSPSEPDSSNRTGARREVLLRVAPVRRADGGISGAVAIVQDLTELRRLERVRRDFVANASHELRTPVANIRAVAETVIDAADDPTLVQRFLPRLVDEAERLSRLVSDLLDLARVDSSLEIVRDRVDLGRVTREVVARLQDKAHAQHISIECDCPGEAWVMGEAPSLEQVVFNLLDNALMYTPSGGRIALQVLAPVEGGPQPLEGAAASLADSALPSSDQPSGNAIAHPAPREASALARPLGTHSATLRVNDTGIGIPAADLPRIFERFYRVDKARSRAQGGTGLGLAIVKHIIERHGGHVSVESEAGQGTTFTIQLPAA